MTETACPLCSTPRPRGAKRCRCNYTFEYDRLRHEPLVGPRGGDRIVGVIALVAVGAAVVAYVLARGAEKPPANPWVASWIAIAGMFTLLGAFTGGRWFLGASRARGVVWVLGASATRVFYGVVGGSLVGCSLGFVTHSLAS